MTAPGSSGYLATVAAHPSQRIVFGTSRGEHRRACTGTAPTASSAPREVEAGATR
jgi:hypothetical protein